MSSEFYRISVAATAIPLDLAGARQVIMQVIDGPFVFLSTDRSMNEYFTVFATGGGAENNTITIVSNDDRLWVIAPTGAAILEVWVMR